MIVESSAEDKFGGIACKLSLLDSNEVMHKMETEISAMDITMNVTKVRI